MNILDRLADHARNRVKEDLKTIPREKMRELAEALPKGNFPFEQQLKNPGLTFICECKKASPSKGVIAEEFDCVSIAKEYEAAGADCLSILTEPKWFLGNDQYLADSASQTDIPILRKDFIIDPYMIDQAKVLGADAVLLIASLLDPDQMKEMIDRAHHLGLSALCEAHDEQEIDQCIQAGARIIGVNNRNLKDFSVCMDNARRLRNRIPRGILYVCESGMKTRADIEQAEALGANGVLIGETLMKAADRKAMLDELKGAV